MIFFTYRRWRALMSFEEWSDCFIWRCNGKHCGGKEVVFAPHDFWGCVAELKSRGWSFHRQDEGIGRTTAPTASTNTSKQTGWINTSANRER